MSKLTGSDLRMAIVEKVSAHKGPHDTAMLREVFDFCWEQMAWRGSSNELQQVITELGAGLDQ